MMPGSDLTPASWAAITKGEADASEFVERRPSLVYGIRRPMKKIVPTKKRRMRQKVFLIAEGTTLRGLAHSAAATPTSSVPW